MNASGFPRLLADVGGTNVRFGSQFEAGGSIAKVHAYACANFESLWDAIIHHLWQEKLAQPRSCAIGIATPVMGDHVSMTNHHWTFSINALKHCLHLDQLLVMNDFLTLALAIPTMTPNELHQIGSGTPVAGQPMGLVGPGTGLGVASLIPLHGGKDVVAIPGEGGHVTLGSCKPEEAAVLKVLGERFGHVSAERAISGPGIENLYAALGQVRNIVLPERTAAEITSGAIERGDPFCISVMDMFCSLLGQVAGNVALTLGTRGGMYIGGGIVPRLGEWFEQSSFRSTFESKGRFTRYLRDIPTYVLPANAEAALRGASRALDLAPQAN